MTGEPVFDENTNLAIKATSEAASHLIMMIDRNEQIEVTVKDDNTLVLNVDLALQEVISQILKNEIIVSEELPETHALIGTSKDFFLVDPLDGTTSCKRFFHGRDTQVGFGPMVGVVKNGVLNAVSFFNAPARELYVAEVGKGAWRKKGNSAFEKLTPSIPPKVTDCGLLFYTGINGELPFVEKIKRKDLVENIYRFGGFANDCSRLARGFEQLQVQFTVKAWDLPATLLISEAGLAVHIRKGPSEWVPITEWKVSDKNPVFAAPHEFLKDILSAIDE